MSYNYTVNIINSIKNMAGKLLPQSKTKKQVLKGVSWLAGDKIVRLAISVFTGALVTRYLGPERYGTLSALTAFAALFGPIANMGVNSIILRDIGAHPEKEKSIIDASIILKMVGGVTSVLLAIAIALFAKQPQYQPLLVVFATFNFLFYFLDNFESWFYARNEQRKPVIAGQISFMFTSALRVACIILNLGLPAILLTYSLDSVLGGVLVYFNARKHLSFRILSVQYHKENVLRLLKESLPLMFASMGTIIFMKIDKVIMPWLTTAYVLGIYSAATRLSELWYFIPFSLCTAFAPLIAAAKSKSPEIYEKRMRKALIVVNLVTMSLALFTLLIGPFAINLYAGSKYVSALPALQVHIWSLPFISIGLVVDIWLLNEHLQRLQVARTFTTAAVNIVLNILLVPKYGAVGAAWATLIAYTYPGFFANLLDKRTRAVFWLELRSIIPTPKNLQLIFEK